MVSTSGCPSGSLWNAIVSPSGDQRGNPGSDFRFVNWTAFERRER
jgi:hypothetical protein